MKCEICGRILYPGNGVRVEYSNYCQWCVANRTYYSNIPVECESCGEDTLEVFTPDYLTIYCQECVKKGRF